MWLWQSIGLLIIYPSWLKREWGRHNEFARCGPNLKASWIYDLTCDLRSRRSSRASRSLYLSEPFFWTVKHTPERVQYIGHNWSRHLSLLYLEVLPWKAICICQYFVVPSRPSIHARIAFIHRSIHMPGSTGPYCTCKRHLRTAVRSVVALVPHLNSSGPLNGIFSSCKGMIFVNAYRCVGVAMPVYSLVSYILLHAWSFFRTAYQHSSCDDCESTAGMLISPCLSCQQTLQWGSIMIDL